MKNFDGYLKQKLGNDYVLLAGGSHKSLSDFSMSGHNHNDSYVTALGTSTDYLTWTKNGTTNNITIPYATVSSKLRYHSMIGYRTDFDSFTGEGAIKVALFQNKGTDDESLVIPFSDGSLISFPWGSSNNYGAQLAVEDTGQTHHLAIRNRNGANSWGAWAMVLTSVNYNLYSPKLDGTGATGTWGINITGDATNLASAPILAAGTTDTNAIKVTAGGKTSNEFIVPYSTKTLKLISSGSLDTSTVNSFCEASVFKMAYLGNTEAGTLFSGSDGFLFSVGVGGGYGHQIHIDDTQYDIWHRKTKGPNLNWDSWVKILDTSNVSPSLNIDGNTIGVTVGGVTSSYITVPFATNSTTATTLTTNPSIQAGTNDTNKVTITVGSKTSSEFTVPYASSSNNSNKLGGYSASISNTPFGTIPVIHSDGYMNIGRQLEFHYDNSTNSDYSTMLACQGNYNNTVYLPTNSGTLVCQHEVSHVSKLTLPNNSSGLNQTAAFWIKVATLVARAGTRLRLDIHATNGSDAPQISSLTFLRTYQSVASSYDNNGWLIIQEDSLLYGSSGNFHRVIIDSGNNLWLYYNAVWGGQQQIIDLYLHGNYSNDNLFTLAQAKATITTTAPTPSDSYCDLTFKDSPTVIYTKRGLIDVKYLYEDGTLLSNKYVSKSNVTGGGSGWGASITVDGKTLTSPSCPNLDSVSDGSSRKLSDYLAKTGGTISGVITFATNDSYGLAATANYSQIGFIDRYFWKGHINNMYSNNISSLDETGAPNFPKGLNSAGNINAVNYYTTSDARKKQNIHKISDNIKQFNWKETGELSYGFVAQDLERKHPELVNDDGNMKTVNYNAAICLLLSKLENRLERIERELNIERREEDEII